MPNRGFPELGVPFEGSKLRITASEGPSWGPLILGNYHIPLWSLAEPMLEPDSASTFGPFRRKLVP